MLLSPKKAFLIKSSLFSSSSTLEAKETGTTNNLFSPKEGMTLKEGKVNKEDKNQAKIDELQARLKQEINEERYEDAANTRDEIKKLNEN